MWRRKFSSSSICSDVCLRVPKSASLTWNIKGRRNYSTTQKEWRIVFEQYVKQNNLSPADWYQLSSSSLDQKTRQIVSKYFRGSLYRALSTTFPEIEWKAWKFQHHRVPNNYWKEQSTQRQFFDDLGHTLGVKTLDDWYSKISWEAVSQHGGAGLLQQYNNSPMTALMAVYPEHKWIPSKFVGFSKGYWSSKDNVKQFFDKLSEKLSIKNMDDWYRVDWKIWNEPGGSNLIKKYKGLHNLLKEQYPHHPWDTNRFQQEWRLTFEQYAKEHKMLSFKDWYQISLASLNEKMSSIISKQFGGSLYRTLVALFPETEWKAWKFQQPVPYNFWKEQSNQRKFFDDLGHTLGVQTLDDWYEKLSMKEILKHGGNGLLGQHNDSPMAALMAVYPEHNWIPWKFAGVPIGYWNSKDNVRKFLNELSEKLSIQTLDDWYQISKELLSQFGASSLITKYGGLYNILKEQYPHHPWNAEKFKQAKKSQRWLAVNLKKIFPDEEILEDYLHPKAVFPTSNRPIQLDIFIPSRSLAFEYQGEQHYQDREIFSPTRMHKQRDEEKRVVCAANNIKLIEIPYWWNKTKEELQDMIAKSGLVHKSTR